LGRLACKDRPNEQQPDLVHSGNAFDSVCLLSVAFLLVTHSTFVLDVMPALDGILLDYLEKDN
jgi:hypothetical protein